MAQAQISDYFGTKKNVHPSKRRKIDNSILDCEFHKVKKPNVTKRTKALDKRKHAGLRTIKEAFPRPSATTTITAENNVRLSGADNSDTYAKEDSVLDTANQPFSKQSLEELINTFLPGKSAPISPLPETPEEEVQKGNAEQKSVPAIEESHVAKEEMESTLGTTKEPAYKLYSHLVKERPKLSLPTKMQRLLEYFQIIDRVVTISYNREKTTFFSTLQVSLESVTHRNFGEKILGQIKTVYPTAYTFSQEKGLPCHGYQLTIKPNLTENGFDAPVNSSGRPTFTLSALIKRKQRFQSNLTDIVIKHHADFLSQLDPPLVVPASKLTRWHPRFPLQMVPDIEPSPLPTPPMQMVQSASQILENTKGNIPKRMEEALARLSNKHNVDRPNISTTSTISKSPFSSYLGISQSLLEKIRAKESAKTLALLTRDPAEDRKTEMMGRLPALIRALRAYYVTEKKPTLPYSTVVTNLAESYPTTISQENIEAHLLLLEELAPEWLQVIKISRGKFIKIDKIVDITQLINKINTLVKSRK